MRFQFGKNWKSFSTNALTEERVVQAREFFKKLIGPVELNDKSFLDVGFGQGLSLCLAAESGARAIGIDIDEENLEAFQITKEHFAFENEPVVAIFSILDENLCSKLGAASQFDIVHSWGVLHHTGDMWRAIERCLNLVKKEGSFVFSIYNQHWSSPVWKVIKRIYNLSPAFLKRLIVYCFFPIIYAAKFLVTLENPLKKERGMNFYYDVIDWVGGWPYEYASAEKIIEFLKQRGFSLVSFSPAQVPTGCNEFVFKKDNLSQDYRNIA